MGIISKIKALSSQCAILLSVRTKCCYTANFTDMSSFGFSVHWTQFHPPCAVHKLETMWKSDNNVNGSNLTEAKLLNMYCFNVVLGPL